VFTHEGTFGMKRLLIAKLHNWSSSASIICSNNVSSETIVIINYKDIKNKGVFSLSADY